MCLQMTDFNKKDFKELSKILDAKKYTGCCYYPCGAHSFSEVSFDKKYNFEGEIRTEEGKDIMTTLNEVLKSRTFDFIRIDKDRHDEDGKLYLCFDLCWYNTSGKKDLNTVHVYLVVTEELFDELENNCSTYGKLKKKKAKGCNYSGVCNSDFDS